MANEPLAPIDTIVQSSQDPLMQIEIYRECNAKSVIYSLPVDYNLWEWIGRGSFGCVYHYEDPISTLDLAMKCIPTEECDFESDKKTVQNEISIHYKLSHPNIVKYYTTKEIDGIFLIFMEHVDGGSIFDRLEKNGPFNENVVINYTYQILKGLAYMHGQEIVHRDLRSKNILVNSQNVIKIADFGISKSFNDTHCSLFNSQVGNPHWRAPELIEGKGKSGRKVDVWSLGIAMYEMLCGDTPWGDIPSDIAQYHIYKGTQKLSLPDSVSKNICNFVNLCLERDCEKRPHSKALLISPLFNF